MFFYIILGRIVLENSSLIFGRNNFLFDFTYRWTKLRISRTYVFFIGTKGLTWKKNSIITKKKLWVYKYDVLKKYEVLIWIIVLKFGSKIDSRGSKIDSRGILSHSVNGWTIESLVQPHDLTRSIWMTRLDNSVLRLNLYRYLTELNRWLDHFKN